MISATLDTNVLISAVLFDGTPRSILRAAVSGEYSLILSPPILAETAGVLHRQKFSLPIELVETIVREIESVSTLVFPEEEHKLVRRDPKDNIIVDCAIAGNVGYIVTGDNDLLSLNFAGAIPIITPVDFQKRLNPS